MSKLLEFIESHEINANIFIYKLLRTRYDKARKWINLFASEELEHLAITSQHQIFTSSLYQTAPIEYTDKEPETIDDMILCDLKNINMDYLRKVCAREIAYVSKDLKLILDDLLKIRFASIDRLTFGITLLFTKLSDYLARDTYALFVNAFYLVDELSDIECFFNTIKPILKRLNIPPSLAITKGLSVSEMCEKYADKKGHMSYSGYLNLISLFLQKRFCRKTFELKISSYSPSIIQSIYSLIWYNRNLMQIKECRSLTTISNTDIIIDLKLVFPKAIEYDFTEHSFFFEVPKNSIWFSYDTEINKLRYSNLVSRSHDVVVTAYANNKLKNFQNAATFIGFIDTHLNISMIYLKPKLGNKKQKLNDKFTYWQDTKITLESLKCHVPFETEIRTTNINKNSYYATSAFDYSIYKLFALKV